MDKNMNDKSLKIIKRTKFFIDKIDRIKVIEDISSNKIRVKVDDISYVLGLYNINDYDNLKNEEKINNYLKEIDLLDTLDLFEIGIMPDINKSYKVFEYRNEISLGEYLDRISKEEAYKIGSKFGSILKNIHIKKIDKNNNLDWYKNVETKVNFLLYRHGLNKVHDNNDYILVDYLMNNKYICKNTTCNPLYQNISYKNIRIFDKDQIDIRGLKEIKVGDGVSDFVNINKIAIKHPDFAIGVIKSYHGNDVISRKFYRLLSFYQAYFILQSLVDIRDNKKSYLSEFEIEKILNMYDNFSEIIPSWIR
ncbi:hypothetical protein ANHYDRO_00791 [Anaerococcus hydrogenalis DSM 7454]|uniref:Kanamycin kinase n=1 Tax=Anaerococcus hydrogenalis DSM 7454 TaxID=561177 RepID=B6W892_9FIRM|nr:hypothetical protein [Anaerococcus hydrogenalis]EEB36491.1 hypothetical protein ANHYDRO_00791 [Anaerococcus hydrogenalis DSM 7454]